MTNSRFRRLSRLLVAALALAGPAASHAQSIDADVTRALETFYPGGATEPAAFMALDTAPIDQFVGRWVPTNLVFRDAPYDADTAADVCGQVPLVIARDGAFGFTVTRTRGGAATGAVVTYTPVGGTTFARTADLDGFAEFLFPNRPLSEMPPQVIAGILTGPDMHGYALVNLFAPDVLVIQGIGSPPLVLARCTG